MSEATPTAGTPSSGEGGDRQPSTEIFWQVAIGLGAGALVGGVVVGALARVLMLVLRLTSPAYVDGIVSDDGFVIGRFSAQTLTLMFITATLGGIGGALYAAVRRLIPSRPTRLAGWSVLSGITVGTTLVQTDGVDFTLLEPVSLAIAGFVLLPAAGALLIAVVVDRWSGIRPRRGEWRTAAIPAAGLLGAPAIAFAGAISIGWIVLSRLPPALRRLGVRVALPVVVTGVIVLDILDLVSDISALT